MGLLLQHKSLVSKELAESIIGKSIIWIKQTNHDSGGSNIIDESLEGSNNLGHYY